VVGIGLLSIFLYEAYRAGDVLGLRSLVSTDEQQKKPITALCVVDAVARTEVHLQLRHSVRQVTVCTGIAMDQAVYTHQDTTLASQILQAFEPVSILVGLLDTHDQSVAYQLQPLQSA
jgi:hypothetical protein